jgi:AraC-like DNA-binding protein/ligand-binding sensor protein
MASLLLNGIDANFASWDVGLSSSSMVETEVARSDSNKQLIDTLRRSKLFRGYEQVFSEATGLPLALRPVDYWQLEHQGKKNENPFCALLAERPATLSVCLQAHQDMIDHTGLLPHSVTCPFGLTETAVPVRLGAEIIGYLRIGQVLRHTPANADRAKVVSELERHGVKFSGEIRKAWEKNPLVPPDRYNATVRLLAFFADQLSTLSNQLMTEKNNAEPPLVLKAREYIDKHKTEELSLADVAKASGASVFHFCKVFHKATGLTFTDYVARVRLEDARTRLLNPNLRVSEIAYDVGFQSLTQFNRTFKRVFGQSPSEFRARLSSHKRSGKTA